MSNRGYCNTGMAEAVMKEPGIVVPEPDHLAIARRSDPIEQARPILFLLSSYSSYVTGENWSVDGGWVI
jgi:NAD(P)-dependent dehydrogenase (short-subunit alcohol dehydrogenase family)